MAATNAPALDTQIRRWTPDEKPSLFSGAFGNIGFRNRSEGFDTCIRVGFGYAAGGNDSVLSSAPDESRRKRSIPRRTALISSGLVASRLSPPGIRCSIRQCCISARTA